MSTSSDAALLHVIPKVPASDLFLDPEERYEVLLVKIAERPHLLLPPEEGAVEGRTTTTCDDGDQARDGGDTTTHNDEITTAGEGGGSSSGDIIRDGGGGRGCAEEKKEEDDDDEHEKRCSPDVSDGGGPGEGSGAECSAGGGTKIGDRCDGNDENNIDEEQDPTPPHPPLTDGCDLPPWRRHRLVLGGTMDNSDVNGEVEGMLNVGVGSVLFRRCDQLVGMAPHGSRRRLRRQLARGGTYRSTCKMGEEGEGKLDGRCWEEMREVLSNRPPPKERDADVIHAAEYALSAVAASNGGGEDDGADGANLTTTATRFAMEYEARNLPAKILGGTVGWDAMPPTATDDTTAAADTDDDNGNVGGQKQGEGGGRGWTFPNLISRFGSIYWRFSDIHGEMLTLNTYNKYLHNPEGWTDDSPLAIYDAEFGDEDSPTAVLVGEYRVPKCFSRDLFELAVDVREAEEADEEKEDKIEDESQDEEVDLVEGSGDGDGTASSCSDGDSDGDSSDSNSSDGEGSSSSDRPPYRWILIGPERSGTGLHVDPLWTNAWVTVLQGRKRWMLFPPSTPPAMIGMFEGKPQISSSVWFRDYYDVVTDASWPMEWRPVEVLQGPGETVFVPNGWAHLVLNLELTVAVTHNYASEFGPFERMWEEVATCEPSFARRWYRGMVKGGRADLARRVEAYHRDAVRGGEDWATCFGELPGL